jgi:hypothetical protein
MASALLKAARVRAVVFGSILMVAVAFAATARAERMITIPKIGARCADDPPER